MNKSIKLLSFLGIFACSKTETNVDNQVITPTTPNQIVVAQNGSGNFKTIQEAINSIAKKSSKERVIFIKNGTYSEKIYLDGIQFLKLKGESEKGVIITIAEARDFWYCNPNNKSDWGVATINISQSTDITLDNLSIINSYGFDATDTQITITCPTDATGQKTVRKDGHQMALRTSSGATRLIAKNCTFRAFGGDTVSPWDGTVGMYYFKDCTIEGGVDFYCPRGWSYAEDCHFICHNTSAALWHDGSANKEAKTVLKNCTFEGDKGYKLGRYHLESQFYLIDCQFSDLMADADIYAATSGTGTPLWGRRVYYKNCHRQSGNDFAWLKDNWNVESKTINSAWAFDGKWMP
ncbi:pectinesterase family protein [Emticicia sp.]|uniref:pectinesterase family protein n=1 Tax=Emticicia sp. TaxID=1930953 RepID=UPI0037524F93